MTGLKRRLGVLLALPGLAAVARAPAATSDILSHRESPQSQDSWRESAYLL
jgi:hypothetical protein